MTHHKVEIDGSVPYQEPFPCTPRGPNVWHEWTREPSPPSVLDIVRRADLDALAQRLTELERDVARLREAQQQEKEESPFTVQYYLLGSTATHFLAVLAVLQKHGLLWYAFMDKHGDWLIGTDECIERQKRWQACWNDILQVVPEEHLHRQPATDEVRTTLREIVRADSKEWIVEDFFSKGE